MGIKSRLTKLSALAAIALISPKQLEAASDLKSRGRPLYIFSPDENAAVKTQRAIIASAAAALADRQVTMIFVVGDVVSPAINRKSADTLRSRFGVLRGAFRAVLVGKDGGIKLSSSEPLGIKRISDTIDAMPMGRRELRERNR